MIFTILGVQVRSADARTSKSKAYALTINDKDQFPAMVILASSESFNSIASESADGLDLVQARHRPKGLPKASVLHQRRNRSARADITRCTDRIAVDDGENDFVSALGRSRARSSRGIQSHRRADGDVVSNCLDAGRVLGCNGQRVPFQIAVHDPP